MQGLEFTPEIAFPTVMKYILNRLVESNADADADSDGDADGDCPAQQLPQQSMQSPLPRPNAALVRNIQNVQETRERKGASRIHLSIREASSFHRELPAAEGSVLCPRKKKTRL
jgi:hypothetical protein